jgi:glutathione S-transferase
MLVLHHAPKSRSTRALWLLEELGAAYTVNYVDIRRMDGSGGFDPANPHPLKQAPALSHDGQTIVESGFIFLYLTDLHPEAGLAPISGAPGRDAYIAWLGLYTGVLEPVITAKFRNPDTFSPQFAAGYEALDAHWKAALERGPYLLGERFSAVDILFGSLLQFFRTVMPPHPVYDEWVGRLNARPALARAAAKDSPPR